MLFKSRRPVNLVKDVFSSGGAVHKFDFFFFTDFSFSEMTAADIT